MQEIERKFLVNDALKEALTGIDGKAIKQGYICNDEGKTVRVRTKGLHGFLTIKGPTEGISRAEYEYEIPLEDAESLLRDFCPKVLSKVRYVIQHTNHLWEVDVFEGKLEGLIVAELELKSEEEEFELPGWIDREVSEDAQYYNSNLIKKL